MIKKCSVAVIALALTAGSSVAQDGLYIDPSSFYVGGMLYGSISTELHSPLPTRNQFRAEYFDLNGISGGVIGGFNFTSGDFLFGIEGRFEIADRKHQATHRYDVWDSQVGYTFTSDDPWIDFYDSFSFTSDWTQQYRSARVDHYTFKEGNSADLSVRIGYVIAPAVIYAKIGGGAVSIRETRINDDTGSRYCLQERTDVTYVPGRYREESYCTVSVPGDVTRRSESRMAPLFNTGLGVEYHFERAFIRAEAEMRHVFLPQSSITATNDMTSWRAGIGAGFRF